MGSAWIAAANTPAPVGTAVLTNRGDILADSADNRPHRDSAT